MWVSYNRNLAPATTNSILNCVSQLACLGNVAIRPNNYPFSWFNYQSILMKWREFSQLWNRYTPYFSYCRISFLEIGTTLVVGLIIKNVSSSTTQKKLRLSENLRKFFLTLSFMNRFWYEFQYYEYANISFLEVWPQRSLKVTKVHPI